MSLLLNTTDEVFCKKRAARCAKYKKNGSKSKKCTLLSDRLTPKQWRERNGEVVSYRLNEPMKWREFKSMPIDIQKLYILKLIETYNVNMVMLSEMFDVDNSLVSRYVKNTLGIILTREMSRKASNEDKSAFRDFCNGLVENNVEKGETIKTEPEVVNNPNGEYNQEILIPWDSHEDVEFEEVSYKKAATTEQYPIAETYQAKVDKKVDDFMYEVSGDLDWDMIYRILTSVSSSSARGHFSMSYQTLS